MSFNDNTTSSPIGDSIPLQGQYKGHNVYITFGGAVVARATDIEWTINNNLEAKYEAGNRHPNIIPGVFLATGSLGGFYFDSMKFNLALGLARTDVTYASDILITENTFPDKTDSPQFGEQPYLLPPKFTITLELEASGVKYGEYIFKGCLIDTQNFRMSQPGDVRENVTFWASSADKNFEPEPT